MPESVSAKVDRLAKNVPTRFDMYAIEDRLRELSAAPDQSNLAHKIDALIEMVEALSKKVDDLSDVIEEMEDGSVDGMD